MLKIIFYIVAIFAIMKLFGISLLSLIGFGTLLIAAMLIFCFGIGVGIAYEQLK